MHAEIISIGDEITSGQNLDTNSQWLSQRLGELGIPVLYHTTVGDELDANVRVFREAIDRADLVIATGGLGPTADDLTRQVLADAAGVELTLDPAVLEWLTDLFRRRGREMPERNRVQAYFPAGSVVIPNPNGTAPGIDLTLGRSDKAACRIFALPGVPAEMKEMWAQTVLPAVRSFAGAGQVIVHKRIKCFGVGESDLEKMLPDLIRRGRYPRVGITVSGATITLRITAQEPTAQQCQAVIEPTIATIHQCLGELVFGEDDDELQHAVVRGLAARQQTLATAEWGTGGLIAASLSEVEKYREVYRGGTIVTQPAAALSLCELPAGWFEQNATNSAAIARELAVHCRERLGADYGLAVSDFPPFDPQATTPGVCHYALATPEDVVIKSASFAAHPEILKTRSAKQALNLLRLHLR